MSSAGVGFKSSIERDLSYPSTRIWPGNSSLKEVDFREPNTSMQQVCEVDLLSHYSVRFVDLEKSVASMQRVRFSAIHWPKIFEREIPWFLS